MVTSFRPRLSGLFLNKPFPLLTALALVSILHLLGAASLAPLTPGGVESPSCDPHFHNLVFSPDRPLPEKESSPTPVTAVEGNAGYFPSTATRAAQTLAALQRDPPSVRCLSPPAHFPQNTGFQILQRQLYQSPRSRTLSGSAGFQSEATERRALEVRCMGSKTGLQLPYGTGKPTALTLSIGVPLTTWRDGALGPHRI